MIETIHHDEKIGFLKFMQAIGDVALWGLSEAVTGLLAKVDGNIQELPDE